VPEEKSSVKSIGVVLAAVLIIAASFGGGVYIGYERRPAIEKVRGVLGQESPAQKEVDFSQFWDVWSRIEDKYVDRSNIDRQKLVYSAIAGLVKGVGDPYTVFFPPQQSKQFKEDVKGSFGGIGAEIGIRKDVLTIITPLKGSPAESAGLKASDKILKINATSSAELLLEEAISYIRGEIGTTVTLTIARNDEIKEVKIIRGQIVVPIVNTQKKENGIFYIHLMNFDERSPQEFRRAVSEYLNSDSNKLVLDLRGNPGGYLDASVDIGSWFIPAGEIVAREQFADGSETLYRSSGYRQLESTPMVVLADQGSASAAEILAGALRDKRGIKIVGAKTFGKGSVQQVDDLPGGASLKITVAKWLTPNGTSINEKGLDPDIAVEFTAKDVENDRDPQLAKALEILAGM
jgi:carboxyl-terminal processing protease